MSDSHVRGAASVSRRRFLQAVGAAGAAAAGGPVILHATNKSGSKRPVVGAGDHTFEVYHDWGELPAAIRYGNTHGVCEDAQGHIYIHHTVNATSERHDSMVVFDRKGRFVKSWGREFEGGAHGLHIRKEGSHEFLYLCDTKRALVVKATTDGEVVWTLGYPKESPQYPLDAEGKPATKYSPTNVAIAPNGDVYVADGYGSSYITQYDQHGAFIRTFGGKGKDAGSAGLPARPHRRRTRDAQPVLLVADRGNRRLQTFSLDGKHLAFYDGTNAPCHFHAHKGVMVVPDLFARVTLVDAANTPIVHLGDNGIDSWKELRTGPRDDVPGRQVRLPAQRHVRSRGQHLRRRMGRGGQGHEAQGRSDGCGSGSPRG